MAASLQSVAGNLYSGLPGGELLTAAFRCNGSWHSLGPLLRSPQNEEEDS